MRRGPTLMEMEAWRGWETARVALALAAVLYAGTWAQLTLMHLGGAFKRWQMWAPVFFTPLLIVALLIALVTREAPWGWVALAFAVMGIGEGLLGLLFHLQGMHYQIGGIRSLRNLVSGPPPLLPVAYSLFGVLAAIALVWDA